MQEPTVSNPWRTHASRTVYENQWIRVREDRVSKPDGTDGIYGVVDLRHPAVFTVALTEDDEVVLVELFRYTTGTTSLEVPAGGSDGEDPLLAAQRELREETGLEADDWEHVGSMHALNGVCNAIEHFYLARGLRPTGEEPGTDEGITAVRRVPWVDVLELVRTGGITDGETVAALFHAAIALGRVR